MKIFKPILASLFLSFVVSSMSIFSMDSGSSTSTTTSSTSKVKKKSSNDGRRIEMFKDTFDQVGRFVHRKYKT